MQCCALKQRAVAVLSLYLQSASPYPRKTGMEARDLGRVRLHGFYWTSTQPEETPDVKLNLTIYSKDVNGKEPAQDGKDIKDTFQSYSMTGKTHTATIKDNLYVKLSPGKDKESKKLFDKVLTSDKYHVKIVFENADGTTAASLLDPKIVKSVQRVTDPETGTKYDAKKRSYLL